MDSGAREILTFYAMPSTLRRRRNRLIGTLTVGLLLLMAAVSATARASESGLPIPRFASLRSDKVNVRTGPGAQYPIEWVFERRGMPVEIVAEHDNYRK